LPDLLINIDNLRSETIPENLPHHTWIQDELAQLVSPTVAPLTNYDFVDVLGTGWLSRFQQRPYYVNHKLGVLPLACHAGSYFPVENTQRDIDVLYVSHLIDPELTLEPYRLGRLPALKTQEEKAWQHHGGSLEQLTAVMLQIVASLDAMTMDALLVLFESESKRRAWLLSLTLENLTDEVLLLLVEPSGKRGRIGNDILSQLKMRPMQRLAQSGVSLQLYGKHWEKNDRLAAFARGSAENGEALNVLHNRSKICINNSALVSFHMRAIEIMASGSFMLSRYISSEFDIMPIDQLFKEGAEIAFFTEENVVEQVHYYLEHDDERERMAKAALEAVRKNHTYKHRAEHILHDVMQRFI
jgi:hypothetical protein